MNFGMLHHYSILTKYKQWWQSEEKQRQGLANTFSNVGLGTQIWMWLFISQLRKCIFPLIGRFLIYLSQANIAKQTNLLNFQQIQVLLIIDKDYEIFSLWSLLDREYIMLLESAGFAVINKDFKVRHMWHNIDILVCWDFGFKHRIPKQESTRFCQSLQTQAS